MPAVSAGEVESKEARNEAETDAHIESFPVVLEPPIQVFRALAEALDVSDAALANLTGISSTTLTRRKRAGQLSPAESEHVLRIATLLERAAQVFEDVGDAAAWLKAPNLSLGGTTPLAYADTEIGAREVENLLGRIDWGVYS